MRLEYPLSSNVMTHMLFALHGSEWTIESKVGIGIVQYRILSFLSTHEGRYTQKDLAHSLGISTKSVSVASASLEEKGCISRKCDEKDQRKRWVTLTNRGTDLLSQAEAAVTAFVTALWRPLATEYAKSLLEGLRTADKVLNLDAPRNKNIRAVSTYVGDAQRVASAIAGETKKAGLTLNEFRILFSLYEYPCGLRPGQLACRLLLYPYEVTEAVGKLVSAGLISQTDDPFDGRAFSLRISKMGLNKISEVAPIVDKWFCNGNWETTSEERESYLESADYIVARLRRIYSKIHAKGAVSVGTQHLCSIMLEPDK